MASAADKGQDLGVACLADRRLRWRCRRGLKELDVLLERYVERCLASAPDAEKRALARLLELPDPALAAMLFDTATSPDPIVAALVRRLRDV